jgi:hypothetical protein
VVLTARSRGPNVVLACAVELDTHPNASSRTYIEAISAIEVITNPIPMAVARKTKIAPPVPPFDNGIIRVLQEYQRKAHAHAAVFYY